MKVAYVFATAGQTIDYLLGDMILPQLEAGAHGADVVGMFFFHDNTYAPRGRPARPAARGRRGRAGDPAHAL